MCATVLSQKMVGEGRREDRASAVSCWRVSRPDRVADRPPKLAWLLPRTPILLFAKRSSRGPERNGAGSEGHRLAEWGLRHGALAKGARTTSQQNKNRRVLFLLPGVCAETHARSGLEWAKGRPDSTPIGLGKPTSRSPKSTARPRV